MKNKSCKQKISNLIFTQSEQQVDDRVSSQVFLQVTWHVSRQVSGQVFDQMPKKSRGPI